MLPGDADDLEDDMGAVIVEYEKLRPPLRGAHAAGEVQQRALSQFDQTFFG